MSRIIATKMKREQREYLLKHWNTSKINDLAQNLGVCRSYVQAWCKELGLKKRNTVFNIPPHIEAYLREHYKTKMLKEIAAELNEDYDRLVRYVTKLGLSKQDITTEISDSDERGFFEHDLSIVTI